MFCKYFFPSFRYHKTEKEDVKIIPLITLVHEPEPTQIVIFEKTTVVPIPPQLETSSTKARDAENNTTATKIEPSILTSTAANITSEATIKFSTQPIISNITTKSIILNLTTQSTPIETQSSTKLSTTQSSTKPTTKSSTTLTTKSSTKLTTLSISNSSTVKPVTKPTSQFLTSSTNQIVPIITVQSTKPTTKSSPKLETQSTSKILSTSTIKPTIKLSTTRVRTQPTVKLVTVKLTIPSSTTLRKVVAKDIRDYDELTPKPHNKEEEKALEDAYIELESENNKHGNSSSMIPWIFVAGILTIVIVLSFIVKVSIAHYKRSTNPMNYKTRGSKCKSVNANEEFSEVRYLTSDEALDFTLLTPDST